VFHSLNVFQTFVVQLYLIITEFICKEWNFEGKSPIFFFFVTLFLFVELKDKNSWIFSSFYSLSSLIYCHVFPFVWPPLWSSGQSSWLQIRRPGFDFRHYQKKKVVGLEWGPLSLMTTTEELLDRKVAAPV
jgi:hypothetical protein